MSQRGVHKGGSPPLRLTIKMDNYPPWDVDHEGLTYRQGAYLASGVTALFAAGTGTIQYQIGAAKPYTGSFIEVPREKLGEGKRLRSDTPDIFEKFISRKRRKVSQYHLYSIPADQGWVFVWNNRKFR